MCALQFPWPLLYGFDLLDDILHFRVIPPESYRAEATAEMEAMMKNPMIAAMMPNTRSMKENLEKISHKEMGNLLDAGE